MTNYIVIGAILILSTFTIHNSNAQSSTNAVATSSTVKNSLTETQKIEHLITSMRSLKGAFFIRNGSEHSAQEAADHLESKWKKHASKIKTAENFIDHLATKSSMSGEVYKIRFADGKVVPTSEVLYKELEQLSTGAKK